jgi:hypothetical protein
VNAGSENADGGGSPFAFVGGPNSATAAVAPHVNADGTAGPAASISNVFTDTFEDDSGGWPAVATPTEAAAGLTLRYPSHFKPP